jgi:zinc protease
VPKIVNALQPADAALPGPNYYRDPALFGQLGNEAGADGAAEEGGAATSLPGDDPVVDFSSRMQRAQVGTIDLIAIDMPITDVVSFVGSFAAGDSLSPDDAPMRASLTASMLDKGTTRQDRFQIAEQLDTLGADLAFGSDEQSLRFSGRFLRSDAEAVMELLAEQLRTPAFDPEVLDTVKNRQKAALLQAIDNPDYRAASLLSRKLYPEAHINYSTPIDALIADLEATTAEDLAAFHQAHYGSQSMRLIFVGDIDFEALQAAVSQTLADWTGGNDYPELETTQLENRAHSERIQIEDKTSVAVRFGYNTELQRTDDDYLPFMVGNYILGGSFHSRLMTEIRKNQGLTYDIRSRHEGDILTPGNWLLAASFAPSMLEVGLQATREVVENWYANGVSEAEVRAAIETLTGSYLVGLSTTRTVAGQVHSFMDRGFEPEYIDAYPLRLRALTAEDVNRAIRQYFNPDQLIEIAAGSLLAQSADQTPPDTMNTTHPVTIRLDTPDAAWRVQIEAIYRTSEGIAVLSRLHRSTDGPAAQVISTVTDSAPIDAQYADLPVRHYVAGKSWAWGESTPTVTFVESIETVESGLKDAELIHRREK